MLHIEILNYREQIRKYPTLFLSHKFAHHRTNLRAFTFTVYLIKTVFTSHTQYYQYSYKKVNIEYYTHIRRNTYENVNAYAY